MTNHQALNAVETIDSGKTITKGDSEELLTVHRILESSNSSDRFRKAVVGHWLAQLCESYLKQVSHSLIALYFLDRYRNWT